MTAPKQLSRTANGAAYPTLKDAKLDRRLLVGGVGAAALALGLSCSTTAGVIAIEPDGGVFDAQVTVDFDAGNAPGSDASAPDAGHAGGDS